MNQEQRAYMTCMNCYELSKKQPTDSSDAVMRGICRNYAMLSLEFCEFPSEEISSVRFNHNKCDFEGFKKPFIADYIKGKKDDNWTERADSLLTEINRKGT